MGFNRKTRQNMYKVDTMTGDAAKNHAKAPAHLWGMGLTSEEVKRVEVVVVWGTGFEYSGPDFTHHVARDANGAVVGQRIVDGY